MTRKLISILLILLIFSSAALADVPVLDLRAHDADARFPSDAAVLTVAFPQMTFADAAILVCDGHAGMIDAGGYAEESAVQTALEALGVTRLDWVVATHPHHGHAAMNQALLTTIAPKLAIITAKPTRAPYALAQLDAMAIPAAHTDECGLLLQSDGQVWILQNLTIEE